MSGRAVRPVAPSDEWRQCCPCSQRPYLPRLQIPSRAFLGWGRSGSVELGAVLVRRDARVVRHHGLGQLELEDELDGFAVKHFRREWPASRACPVREGWREGILVGTGSGMSSAAVRPAGCPCSASCGRREGGRSEPAQPRGLEVTVPPRWHRHPRIRRCRTALHHTRVRRSGRRPWMHMTPIVRRLSRSCAESGVAAHAQRMRSGNIVTVMRGRDGMAFNAS